MAKFDILPPAPTGLFFTRVREAVNKLVEYFKDTDDSWNIPRLLNSWTHYGGIYQPISYRKGADNIVQLRGLAAGGTPSSTDVMFILPVGYRPANKELYPALTNSGIGRLDITINGEVMPYSGGGTWFTLSGITFEASK